MADDFRERLERVIRECDELIADAGYVRDQRPGSAAAFAPDTIAEAYYTRQRCVEALARLDEGEG
jgi:hypothetical protein